MLIFQISSEFLLYILNILLSNIKIAFRYKADQLKGLENEMKQLKSQLSEREDRLINIQKQLDRERDEKMAVLEEKNRDEEVWTAEKQHMLVEKMDLKQQLVDITAKKEGLFL